MVNYFNVPFLAALLWLLSTNVWAYGNEYSDIGLEWSQYQSQDGNFPSDYPNVLDRNGFNSNSVSTNDKDENDQVDWWKIGSIAYAEIAFAALAQRAAENPNDAGGVFFLMAPFAFGPEGVSLGGKLSYAALIGYNLSIDEDDYSESEVARNNFLLLNLFLVVGAFSEDSDDNGKHSFTGIRPTKDGILFTKNFRFD